MNSINITGRLTATPELKQTPSGVAVCTFTVATSRPHVKDTTDFIRCVAWRNTAEFVSRYFTKGKMIAVSGALTIRNYEDANGKHTVAEVLADTVDFCGDKAKGGEKEEPVATAESQGKFETVNTNEELPF